MVVSFQPDAHALGRLLVSLLPQVHVTVVVDNASGPPFADALGRAAELGCAVLVQARNVGLAAGLNAGIAWARERGYAYVLLLDQDSIPDEDMVLRLRRSFDAPPTARPVAAAGPRFVDPRDRCGEGFVRFSFPRHRRLHREPGAAAVECDHLITSGSLLRMAAIDVIGGMDERLFIDNVDLEWGMRARAHGHVLIGVWDARLVHNLGDGRRRVLPPLPLRTVIHKPLRLYYIMRNRLLLYRRANTPALWVIHDLPRVPLKFLVFALLVPPRLQNARMMLRGIVDALRGRDGPADRG